MVTALEPATRYLSIGTVARLAGCSPETIRNMERRGQIPAPARLEGQDRRVYTLADVEAIRTIRAATPRREGES